MSVTKVRNALASIADGRTHLKSHRLVERVAEKAKIPEPDCILAMEKIRQDGEIECDWYNGAPLGNVKVNLPIPENIQIKIDWRAEVKRHYFPGSTKKLLSTPILLEGRTHNEVISALEHLVDYQYDTLLLREVSSRLFWGLSKVLDSKEHLVTELLGLDQCPFPKKPLSVMVHFPKGKPKGILFIENEVSFMVSCQGKITGAEQFILLFSSGYKTGTPRIRVDDGAVVFVSASSMHSKNTQVEGFFDWLHGNDKLWPVYFWGDLDFSGMDILSKLRKVFPRTEAWKQGYIPMLKAIENGNGHTPKESGKEKQDDPGYTGCNYADNILLKALRKHKIFMDQE